MSATESRWTGMLIQLDTTYPNGSRILESGVTIRKLPLPVKYRRTCDDGCTELVVVGYIDQVEIRDGAIYASGTFFDSQDLDMPPLVASTINTEAGTGQVVTNERLAD
jgi:hypothetical protein